MATNSLNVNEPSGISEILTDPSILEALKNCRSLTTGSTGTKFDNDTSVTRSRTYSNEDTLRDNPDKPKLIKPSRILHDKHKPTDSHGKVRSKSPPRPVSNIARRKNASPRSLLESNIPSIKAKPEDFRDQFHSKGYRYLGMLGSGGYGAVSLCKKLETGENMAIKMVLFNNNTRSDVLLEEGIWKSLDHNNIISLIETFPLNDTLCFVQKHATGGDLFQYLKKLGSPSISLCKSWLNQIFTGLIFMHSEKLVAHLDLKLKNILLSGDNIQVYLADFGLSKKMNSTTETCRGRQGTPGHIPPEVLKGEDYNPFLVDVWGVGVVTYHLLSGELPFSRTAPLQELLTEQKTLSLPFTRLNRRDPNTENFIRQAFTYNPSHRPSMKKLSVHAFLQTG